MSPVTKTYILLIFVCLISVGISIKCYSYTCEGNCEVINEPRARHLRPTIDCAPDEHCATSRPHRFSGSIFRGCTSDKNYCDTHHPELYMCYTCNEDLCNDV
ncbi:hypothetical protein RN001_013387 [Aquatica leii]|uniref:Uncharacterized protein n=1 Tax=Aquatica leii TaxID=1421715 RepID=A0AAN7PRQ1_9COLE|nr:hypothetical protein RN001_013387 [Aquatica leii]